MTLRVSPSGVIQSNGGQVIDFVGAVSTTTNLPPIGGDETVVAQRTFTVENDQTATIQFLTVGDVTTGDVRKTITVAPVVNGVVGAETILHASTSAETRGYHLIASPGVYRARCYMAISGGSAAPPVAAVNGVDAAGALCQGVIVITD